MTQMVIMRFMGLKHEIIIFEIIPNGFFNNFGLFDKIMPMKNGFWILPVGTGLLILPMKIGLLILLIKIGLLILPMGTGLLILPRV